MDNSYVSLESSLLKGCSYNQEHEQLCIFFKNEESYVYENVTLDTYEGLLNASSQGSYFSKNIRGKFNYNKNENKS